MVTERRPVEIQEVCRRCWQDGLLGVPAGIGEPCPLHGTQHDTVKLLGHEIVDITLRSDWVPDPERVARAIKRLEAGL